MRCFLCLLLLCFNGVKAESAFVIDVVHSENFDERYLSFLNGRGVMEVDSFYPTTNGTHLEIIERILLQQALYLGGETRPITFRSKPQASASEFDAIIDGKSVILARTVWHDELLDFKGSLYISEPIINLGEYQAGLFVSVNNKKETETDNLKLSDLTVVVNPRWRVDWLALSNSPITMISHIGKWEDMLAMVDANIVDAMMINFSVGEGLELNYKGEHFTPIKNVKVVLPDTRHFIVSKTHPEGKKVIAALEKGLKILRHRGVITKALKQSGFINEATSDWQIINQQMIAPKIND